MAESARHEAPFVRQEKVSPLTLSDRRTPELVIAFIGPVGSGVTTSVNLFAEILARDYKYQIYRHKISQIIQESASLVSARTGDALSGSDRILHLQDTGNSLRAQFGPAYLAQRVVEQIATIRLEKDGVRQKQRTVSPTTYARSALDRLLEES
jgi:hypothetical protein